MAGNSHRNMPDAIVAPSSGLRCADESRAYIKRINTADERVEAGRADELGLQR